MKILAIETSCDETAVAILDCEGGEQGTSFTVLGNALLSQVALHAKYGGVYPNLAKREHAKNLVPILEEALKEAGMLREDVRVLPQETRDAITKLLEREPSLDEATLAFLTEIERPALDAIAVTAGPGLEPALWVGINFARALALVWELPIIAVNHMEGHILAALAQPEAPRIKDQKPNEPQIGRFEIKSTALPVLALLISGGHTELVLMKKWLHYELVGQTRDDAVGEAFDKVARMLELPYPGGPEISKLAEQARSLGFVNPTSNVGFTKPITLPRPMIHDDTCDFSFSGLKTAVLYLLKERGGLSPLEKQRLAREFEDAVADVLWRKAARALEATGAKALAIGGGVSANTHIRRVFTQNVASEHTGVTLRIPTAALTTDNAIMIALAGYYHALAGRFADPDALKADGNLRLA